MRSIVIVESKNDKAFVEVLAKHISLSDTAVENISLEDNDLCVTYQPLEFTDSDGKKQSGLGALPQKLKEIKRDLIRNNDYSQLETIGILLDIDHEDKGGGRSNRLKQVNQAIKGAFGSDIKIDRENQFFSLTAFLEDGSEVDLKFACYFTNIEGKGELETVLKQIKAQDSPYADCLEKWKECVEKTKEQKVSQKEFDKFWLSNYIRFDTCSKDEMKRSEEKCSMKGFEYIMKNKPNIFDLNHSALDDMKKFLSLFK